MTARKGAIRPAMLPIIIMPQKATRNHTRLKNLIQSHTNPYKATKDHTRQSDAIIYMPQKDNALPPKSLFELNVCLTSYRNMFCYIANIFRSFQNDSTPTTRTRIRTRTRATKLLLGPLSIARGQKQVAEMYCAQCRNHSNQRCKKLLNEENPFNRHAQNTQFVNSTEIDYFQHKICNLNSL